MVVAQPFKLIVALYATLPELQLAGGWQSPEMPGHYTKQANVKRGGMAKLSAKRKR